jgi:hypothetical protein
VTQVIALALRGHRVKRSSTTWASGLDMAAIVRACGFGQAEARPIRATARSLFARWCSPGHSEQAGTGFRALRRHAPGAEEHHPRDSGRVDENPLYGACKAAHRWWRISRSARRMGQAIAGPCPGSEQTKTPKRTTLLVYGDSDIFEPHGLLEAVRGTARSI